MTAIPREIRLSRRRTRLDVIWEHGTTSRLAAATLRAFGDGAATQASGDDKVKSRG